MGAAEHKWFQMRHDLNVPGRGAGLFCIAFHFLYLQHGKHVRLMAHMQASCVHMSFDVAKSVLGHE